MPASSFCRVSPPRARVPRSSISFLIAGFVALLAALSLAELATGMPVAGGSYHYVNRALGGVFGSIVGWGMWTGLMFASAFYMIGFGQYIVGPLAFLDGRALIVLLGVLGLSLIVGINYYGTDESSGAQNVMIGAEFVVVLAYVALGVFYVDPSEPQGLRADRTDRYRRDHRNRLCHVPRASRSSRPSRAR
ncbi:MAG: APC family permease [Halobacteriales archaeon]|nr:APC family permease [Halobacteriales archaeon]